MKSILNRREFLGLAGMVGAGAALGPTAMRLLAETQQSGKDRPNIVMDALKRDLRVTSETVFCYKDYNPAYASRSKTYHASDGPATPRWGGVGAFRSEICCV